MQKHIVSVHIHILWLVCAHCNHLVPWFDRSIYGHCCATTTSGIRFWRYKNWKPTPNTQSTIASRWDRIMLGCLQAISSAPTIQTNRWLIWMHWDWIAIKRIEHVDNVNNTCAIHKIIFHQFMIDVRAEHKHYSTDCRMCSSTFAHVWPHFHGWEEREGRNKKQHEIRYDLAYCCWCWMHTVRCCCCKHIKMDRV